jgi:GNAT superfamily N-acetyltransferase
MHGHMPVVFDVDGREQLGHLAQDDLLHPNARGKGLGQVLLEGVPHRRARLCRGHVVQRGEPPFLRQGGVDRCPWVPILRPLSRRGTALPASSRDL